MAIKKNSWPAIKFEENIETYNLLHQWTQIVGKVRLKKSPWQNHSWHVTLYVDSQGLTTGCIPYEGGVFEIIFDFNHHELKIKTSNGPRDRFSLGGQTVASFYSQLMEKLEYLGIHVKISTMPNEIVGAIPFPENKKRVVYQANAAQSLWKALVQIQNTFGIFRAEFTGKNSPIHFFWGSFDLAYTRFSGKKAPTFTGEVPNIPLAVMQEAYSHEVFSVGFWPGSDASPKPIFYAYCYPNYPEFKNSEVSPKEAVWSEDLGEFILDYEVVQSSESPQKTLLEFLRSTYAAGAAAGNWDRERLDCDFSWLAK